MHKSVASVKGSDNRVLVVDDDDGFRLILNRLLSGLGFEVTEASSAGAALELIRSSRVMFPLIVTDYEMPGISGVTFIRSVVAMNLAEAPSFVLITSADMDGPELRLFRSEVESRHSVFFVRKGEPFDRLRTKIESIYLETSGKRLKDDVAL